MTAKSSEPTSLPEQEHESDQIEKNRYRFGGVRYGLRGPSRWQSDYMVPDLPELMTSPRTDT